MKRIGAVVAELVFIDIDLIDDHPNNPRVVLREDVVDGIAANLEGDFPKQHALHVRNFGDRFQLISGHHRKQAAIKKGLHEVWCWVEDMSDEDAFMALVTSNNQGELDPLEIGIHAFEAVPISKGGRGSKGTGQSLYAERIGKAKSTVSELRNAGEVIVNCSVDRTVYLGKSQHLCAVHKLPFEAWQSCCDWLASAKCSVADVQSKVDRVKSALEEVENPEWFPVAIVCDKLLGTADFSASSIKKLQALADSVLVDCIDGNAHLAEGFKAWAISEAGKDSWNVRKVEAKLEEIKSKLKESVDSVSSNWHLGDWRDALGTIEDGRIKLLLTDPPYGMGYSSNRRKDKHEDIANDSDLGLAKEELFSMLTQIKDKMDENSHLLVFCRWDSEGAFQATLRNVGFNVKGSIVWVKNNHGAGDLKGGFAPKHERIVHAVKGNPPLFVRECDVIESTKESTSDHPTEKPVELLKRLIEATTVEGQFVFDPFGGVGSTLVAAKELNRLWCGAEISEEYHKVGATRLGG